MTEVLEHNPETKLILCEPFILPVKLEEDVYKARHKMVREEIEALHRISDDYHTLYVPLADKFEEMCQVREPSYWIWDGIHPTEAGHGVIADQWMRIVLESGILGFKE